MMFRESAIEWQINKQWQRIMEQAVLFSYLFFKGLVKHAIQLFCYLLPASLSAQVNYSWEKTATLDITRKHGSSVCVADSVVYVLGGFDGSSIDRNFYELKGDRLSKLDIKYPGKSFISDIIFYADSTFYVGGGQETNHSHYSEKDFWKYDLRTRKWDRLNKLPFAYQGAPEVHHRPDGTPYVVVARHDGHNIGLPACIYTYSIADDKWTLESICPDKYLLHPRTFVINEELYVFFESFKYANWFSGELMKYNFAAKRWSTLAKFPFSKRLACFAFSDGTNGFVGGGFYDEALDDIYRYDPSKDQWSFANTLENKILMANTWTVGNQHYIGFGLYQPIGLINIWRLRKE